MKTNCRSQKHKKNVVKYKLDKFGEKIIFFRKIRRKFYQSFGGIYNIFLYETKAVNYGEFGVQRPPEEPLSKKHGLLFPLLP